MEFILRHLAMVMFFLLIYGATLKSLLAIVVLPLEQKCENFSMYLTERFIALFNVYLCTHSDLNLLYAKLPMHIACEKYQ